MFVFSSRRRHTRYWRDWSSDVCSSDLQTHRHFAVCENYRLFGQARHMRMKPRCTPDVFEGEDRPVPHLVAACLDQIKRCHEDVGIQRTTPGFEDPIHVRRGANCYDEDRKSTRLNSSHANISYAVFCLKKKT